MEDEERLVANTAQQSDTPTEMPSSTAVLQTQPSGLVADQANAEISDLSQKSQPPVVGFMPASVAASMAAANERWDETPEDDIVEETIEMGDVKNVVNTIEDNLDEALGTAAQSLWSFASSVTGVAEATTFDRLRQNVSSHLGPLGQNLSSKLEQLAPADRVANLAGSVKNVAKTVQRNAQEMERAILAKANGEGDIAQNNLENEIILDDVAAGGGTGTRGVAVPKIPSDPKNGTGNSNNEQVDKDKNAEGAMKVEEEIVRVGEMVGASIENTVGRFWSGLWGADVDEKWEMVGKGGQPGQLNLRAPTTRFEKRIYDLQANPDTYCEPANDMEAFADWGNNFNLDDHADECIEILSRHEAIAELYERVVPNIVDEDSFWMRYYFAKHVLEQEEARRQRLLERAESGIALDQEDDEGWGDDDWDDDSDVAKNRIEDNKGDGKRGEDIIESGNDVGVISSGSMNAADPGEPTIEEEPEEGSVALETTVVQIEGASEPVLTEEKSEDNVEKGGADDSAQENTEINEEEGTEREKRKIGKDDASSNAAIQLVANDPSGDGDWGDDWE